MKESDYCFEFKVTKNPTHTLVEVSPLFPPVNPTQLMGFPPLEAIPAIPLVLKRVNGIPCPALCALAFQLSYFAVVSIYCPIVDAGVVVKSTSEFFKIGDIIE